MAVLEGLVFRLRLAAGGHGPQEQPGEAVLLHPRPHRAADPGAVPQAQGPAAAGEGGLQAAQVQPLRPPLSGEHQAAHVPLPVRGEGGLQRREGVLRAGEIGLQDPVPPAAQGDELPPAPARLRFHVEDALLPGLVKAPALGAAGVGPEGRPLPLQAAALVDVAQSQVVQAAAGDGGPGDGGVVLPAVHLPVEDGQLHPALGGLGPEAGQGVVPPVGGGEGAPPDGAPQVGEFHSLEVLCRKNMYVVRPVQGGVQGLGAEKVVVARGDEHRTGDLPQVPGQGLGGLPVGLPPVQQVAGQEHQVRPPLRRQPGQAAGQLPLLPAPLGGLLGRQAGEGAVQVEVSPVDQFYHGARPLLSQGWGTPPQARRGPPNSLCYASGAGRVSVPAWAGSSSGWGRDTWASPRPSTVRV